jgi:hypothetical protein
MSLPHFSSNRDALIDCKLPVRNQQDRFRELFAILHSLRQFVVQTCDAIIRFPVFRQLANGKHHGFIGWMGRHETPLLVVQPGEFLQNVLNALRHNVILFHALASRIRKHLLVA